MKIHSYIYDQLKDLENSCFKKSKCEAKRISWIIFGIILTLIIGISILNYCRNGVFNDSGVKLHFVNLAGISMVFLFLLFFLKDFWNGLLFSYKDKMMTQYYLILKKKNLEYKSWKDQLECTLILAPSTGNGRLIGTLESLLYVTAILVQSYTFIGFILAVRSYVAVSSHPNKEESEFYIIGILGNLVFAVGIVLLYTFTLKSFTGVNIIEAISQYLPNKD